MISDRLRSSIRDRAKGLCEYCLCPAGLTSAPYHCEHILPKSVGGETTLDNLAWSCPSCNHHKHTKTRAIDPQTMDEIPLFHPANKFGMNIFNGVKICYILLVRHLKDGQQLMR